MKDHETVRKVLAEIKDDDVVALARRLIAIRSTTFEEGAIADFVAEYMKGIGLEVEMMTVEHPDDPNKQTRQPIGRLRGTGGGPTLMLNAHMDVCHMMPGWTVDPYEGKYEDGWIWGIGAQDDKGGLAAALVGLAALKRSGVRLKGDILMCPVASHKLGGTGTRTLLRKGVRADYCINVEHSDNTVGSVVVGSIRVKIRTTSPGLFFRFTPEARATYFNAIEQQALLVQKFGPSLVPLPEDGWLNFKRHPELPDFPMLRYDSTHKEHYGRFSDLEFQIRTVPGMTLDSVRSDVERVLAACKQEHPTLDYEVSIPAGGPNDPFYMEPTELPDNHPLVVAVSNGYIAATGKEPRVGSVERVGNFGDGNVLQEHGIPSVQFGPGDIKRYPEWPAPDECVHISQLMTTAKSCVHAVMELCG